MKLFEALEFVKENNTELISKIEQCIKDRLFWMELRDMDSSDKYAELEFIFDMFDVLDDEDDINIRNNIIKEIKENLEDYQFEYGGLSRLKVD